MTRLLATDGVAKTSKYAPPEPSNHWTRTGYSPCSRKTSPEVRVLPPPALSSMRELGFPSLELVMVAEPMALETSRVKAGWVPEAGRRNSR
jgi:hypothetical protein